MEWMSKTPDCLLHKCLCKHFRGYMLLSVSVVHPVWVRSCWYSLDSVQGGNHGLRLVWCLLFFIARDSTEMPTLPSYLSTANCGKGHVHLAERVAYILINVFWDPITCFLLKLPADRILWDTKHMISWELDDFHQSIDFVTYGPYDMV